MKTSQKCRSAYGSDGTRITTADGQQIAPGTISFIRIKTNEHFYIINSLAKFFANSVIVILLTVNR